MSCQVQIPAEAVVFTSIQILFDRHEYVSFYQVEINNGADWALALVGNWSRTKKLEPVGHGVVTTP